MARASRIAIVLAALAIVGAPSVSGAGSPPLWVQHVENYPGGISNGVRARLAASEGALTAVASGILSPSSGNVQMNTDCEPPFPQNETSVALSLSDPMNAVAAANDYCGDGFWIGATKDGGETWATTFKDPKTSNGERCFGADPSVAYSRRDAAFYLSTLCYFSTSPISEVQVWKSVDKGATWTDSFKASVVITNRAPDGSIDPSVFYDKELLAIDNTTPSSAHYGRIYVTFIKFHMASPSGRSDYCPVQVGFTDSIPTADPRTATWTTVAVVPDDPGSKGIGPSANQWAMPVVDDTGALDVAYASEDCNTAFDRGLFFKRSTDGGNTFGSVVQIDKPGQFADNPNYQDLLPAKHARLGISPSIAFDPTRDRLLFAYQNNVDRTVSDADISLQTSGDHGATWSDAQFISITGSGAPAPKDQYYPWLAVDDSGNIHAIWFDNRNDPGNKLIETFQALSTDGGTTWTNFDISTESWNPDKSFFSCGCFIGDYNGIAASDEVIYPVWTDGRDTPGQPLGQTDIFTNVEVLD